MSNDARRPSPAVNQFGTPVGQFGTPAVNQFGTPVGQFGTPTQPGAQHPYGWAPPTPAAPPRGRSAGALLWVVAALAVVAGAGVLARYVVFPDLSKPIALPSTVAGVAPMGTGGTQPVTLQSKDTEGRAIAMGVYADDAVAPRTMAVVTAGRVKDLRTDEITGTTSTIAHVTCTDELDTGTLVQAGALQRPDVAAMRALTTGAACWRTSRHLTVLVVALSADGAAKAVASRAVTEAWRAI